jgi:hypothetical protein
MSYSFCWTGRRWIHYRPERTRPNETERKPQRQRRQYNLTCDERKVKENYRILMGGVFKLSTKLKQMICGYCALSHLLHKHCLNITACMAGAINTRRYQATSTYLAKYYKQILSYRKWMTHLHFIPQSGRKKKTLSINQTAIISINIQHRVRVEL